MVRRVASKKRWFVSYTRVRGSLTTGLHRSVGMSLVDQHPVHWVLEINNAIKQPVHYDQIILNWWTTDVPDGLSEEFIEKFEAEA